MTKTPQIIAAVYITLEFVGGFVLHGTPHSSPNINGALSIADALFLLCLLGWGGFWESDE